MVEVLVLALATFRISFALAVESGPFGIFGLLRARAGAKGNEYPADDVRHFVEGTTELSKMLLCPLCSSPLIGAAWVLFYLLLPKAAFYAALPFALSGLTVLIYGTRGIQRIAEGL